MNERDREARRERVRDWLASLEEHARAEGDEATRDLLSQLERRAASLGIPPSPVDGPPFVNTLPYPDGYPGDLELEERVEALVRWNAMALVARSNRATPGIGGHIGSYASAATAIEVLLTHFVRGHAHPEGPDRLFLQGHASPGIYARAFLEGRLDASQLDRFRRETAGGGLSSYPHPWLMPDFWETPTVSMGLAPILAIYQARFDRYLVQRGLREQAPHTWAVLGDGEMDEPESLGALRFAAGLGHLTFVIDGNLQRLDGPVRGGGRALSELARLFEGAGWRVLQVLWNGAVCALLEADRDGLVAARIDATEDATWQRLAAEGEEALRAHLVGDDPHLREVAKTLGPFDRGGHDRRALHAALAAARDSDRPTVVLAHTVKGRGLGEAGEAQNVAHKTKDLEGDALRAFRDRLGVPVSDEALDDLPLLEADDAMRAHLEARREALGGPRPRRVTVPSDLEVDPTLFERFEGGSEREVTTTAWLVRLLGALLKDDSLGPRLVPIVPDEARTFGMEALFPRIGVHVAEGEAFEPVDAGSLVSYDAREDGQLLEEGITEGGAMGSFVAAGTGHANGGPVTLPFFFFYSMFGFQRVGDLIWAAGDARARGFLIGATSGRTTLNGEGLQHQDGHSHLTAHAYPTVRPYDVAYGYELAAIVRDGMRRMLEDDEDVIVYLTVANEPYPMPPMPAGARDGIVRGLHRVREVERPQVSLLGCGPLLRAALDAAERLEADHGVAAEVWSVTSFTLLHRDCCRVERWNRLHPMEEPVTPFLREALGEARRPFVAVTDWVKALPQTLARWLPGPLHALGTDGFGRSDTREALRRHFEVDADHTVIAALAALADEGVVARRVVQDAIEAASVDPEAETPLRR